MKKLGMSLDRVSPRGGVSVAFWEIKDGGTYNSFVLSKLFNSLTVSI